MTSIHLDQLSEINAGQDRPAKFAVIGNPVAHSLSPQLHQPALDALAMECRYVRVEVPEGRVAEAFGEMYAAGFIGINVTVPHKMEALEACDEVDRSASLMRAVNTIVFDKSGRKTGFNTDGPGFVRAVREDFGMDLGDLKVAIIGAGGGAGRAIATQCCLEDCPQLVLANRTFSKLKEMQSTLSPLLQGEKLEGPGNRLEIYAIDNPELGEAIAHCDLIINTTSMGLKSADPSPLPQAWIGPHHLIYDTIYNPSRTGLLKAAERKGAKVANGLSLLLHQGALSLEYWTQKEVPLEEMRVGLREVIMV